MSLAAGARLGPYEIVSLIGKGGMGEVYRARDTKLDREVAIKVLPEEFTKDDERLARFEREARLLASLNHPNIAGIYGLEESGGVKALVLELVEGPTLAEYMERAASINAAGPHPHGGRSGDSAPARQLRALPVEEAIAIAKQMAEALEAGHEAGVVHRDLKPANVKVKDDGTVKVLDYGLAKAIEEDAPGVAGSELSQSPTLTRQGTQVGVILGTAPYMSPEQAKGKRVDKRTDIFAFGAVVFEMLTGKRAFAGEDVAETLAHVLTKGPEWEALPPETPSAVRQVLRVCLAKDAKDRVRDIGDVRLLLQGAFETEATPEPRIPARKARALLAASGILAVITAVATSGQVHSDILSVPLDGSAPEPTVLLATPADELWPKPSPDGRWLAYATNASGAEEARVAPLADLAASIQVSTRGGSPIRWSPDSTKLYFTDGDTIASVDVGPSGPVLASRSAIFSVPGDQHGRVSVTADGNHAVAIRGGFIYSDIVIVQNALNPSR